MRIALFLSWIALSIFLAGPLLAGGIADLTPPPVTLAWTPNTHALPPTLRAEDMVCPAKATELAPVPMTQPAATSLADVAPLPPTRALPEVFRPAPANPFEVELDLSDTAPETPASALPRGIQLTSSSPTPELLAVADHDHTLQRLGLLSVVLLGGALVLLVILRVSSADETLPQ